MKTAMQQLLDITYNSISNVKELKNNGMNDPREMDIILNVYNVYRVIIEKNMLEKEKEQIIDAFDYGYHCASNGTSAEITLDGNMHYNEKYNK